ncbi:LysM peptidoglycan-binding domain-containing protein [Solibacillus sp. FSL K6-1523]|uniref:LysM peptidoglycan-binding domain-containing protein n=1 Tax=Solibacillus sp. FSL K6-1523 TaxID=2921471 RepID=UPI0030F535D9
MTKEDYREKVEEHRQEIDLHNEEIAKVSRVKRHRKPGAKKRKNPLMTVLVVFFILLPLSMLGYVWLFYEPQAKAPSDKEVVESDTQQVVIEKQDPEKTPIVDVDESKEDDEAKKQEQADLAKSEQEKQRLIAEEAKKAEEKAMQEQKVAAQKAKELEEKKKAEEQAKAQQKTHLVSPTDNLYQIAIKYYGDGSPANIEKIIKANNLPNDNIFSGQKLIIAP